MFIIPAVASAMSVAMMKALLPSVEPSTMSEQLWAFVFLFGTEIPIWGIVIWLARQLDGPRIQRAAKLCIATSALFGGALASLWILLSFSIGDDPYAAHFAPHFWTLLTASILIPALAGATTLAHRSYVTPHRVS